MPYGVLGNGSSSDFPEGDQNVKKDLVKPTADIVLGGFTLSRCGLSSAGKPSFDDWRQVGQWLQFAGGAVHWWIGDWLNYGERAYGEKYSEALDMTGFDYQTVANDKYVAGQVEFSRRRENLSFAHHAEVAALSPKQQDRLLDRAEKNGWTRAELRSATKEKAIESAASAAGGFAPGEYGVIYADPPWQYFDQRTGGVESGAASAQYPTMPVESICDLKDADGKLLRDVVASDAALFLWATAPCLPEAMRVVASWGFDYKAQFIWDKVRGYNGHYNDVQHELLLIGLRGSCPPADGPLRKSIITEEKTKHSRKPAVFYEIIESMYPGSPKLELFARGERQGWNRWGNEA